MDLSGPIFTVYTAFNREGQVDYAAIERYIGFLYAGGARVFYVMPYNSRYSQLQENEILELNEFCIRVVRGLPGARIIVADPIHGPTSLKAEYARRARIAGADAFSSIFREKFYSDEQVAAHYREMAGQGIPIVVHEMPFISGYSGENMHWPHSLFSRIAEIPEVVAVKEDAKTPEISEPYLREFGNRFSFMIAGRKRFLMPLLKEGRHGYLNGLSMLEPAVALAFWNLVRSGARDRADRFVTEVDDPFWDVAVSRFGWHRANKAALSWRGHMGPYERLPLLPLSDSDREAVGAVVDECLGSFYRWES